ncbi:MAG TPA: TRAP transporter large permease [Alphaproteobacteria bacterium]|nr:TRAP transporter large permease [Alphaproteobacteria bacterium]
MSNLELAGASFLLLLALIFLRMPIAVAMMICGLGGSYFVFGGVAPLLAQLKTLPFETFSNSSLAIIPLFLLMGQFATRGGLSSALFETANVWIGHRRGGVAMAAIGACAGFGAICGSSTATAATMGQVALPELRRHGYADSIATGALAAGGTLGILIPPSIILVIYAVLAEQNIAKLFLAAFVPGFLAAIGYMVAIAIYVRLFPMASGSRPPAAFSEKLAATIDIWPVALIFALVFGGIYLGFFTPTEAAAVGAAGTGLVALARSGLKGRAILDALLETAVSTGMIFFIVLGAATFNTFLAVSQLPQTTAMWVADSGFEPFLVLGIILLIYLLLGCVMDSMSMILLTIPIFFPILSALDFGLGPEEFAIWFGIIALIVVELGLITPPVGMNLFIINSMGGNIPIGRTYAGAVPFILTDIVRVTLLVAMPGLTLFLVRLFY